jgi:hypothetical protein
MIEEVERGVGKRRNGQREKQEEQKGKGKKGEQPCVFFPFIH